MIHFDTEHAHLQGIRNNSFETSALLIIDEDVVLADSKQKLKTALFTLNATLAFLFQNSTLAFKRSSL